MNTSSSAHISPVGRAALCNHTRPKVALVPSALAIAVDGDPLVGNVGGDLDRALKCGTVGPCTPPYAASCRRRRRRSWRPSAVGLHLAEPGGAEGLEPGGPGVTRLERDRRRPKPDNHASKQPGRCSPRRPDRRLLARSCRPIASRNSGVPGTRGVPRYLPARPDIAHASVPPGGQRGRHRQLDGAEVTRWSVEDSRHRALALAQRP
jgi:hypothetical protein